MHPTTGQCNDREDLHSETEVVESSDSEVDPGTDGTPEAQENQLQQQVEIQAAAEAAEAEAAAAAACTEETTALRAQQMAAAERKGENRIMWNDFIEAVRDSLAQLRAQHSNFRIESWA